jgi:uncharacterized protein YndB with AHSA1/START domain
MALDVPDELTRTIDVAATPERVWAAITEPDQLLGWFPDRTAEVDLREGGAMRFVWDEGEDEAVIDVLDPPMRLVFRWRPAGLDRPYTTVTFRLEATAGGLTRVTLTESGFAALPDQIHEQSYEGNAKGWGQELEELRAYLERSA